MNIIYVQNKSPMQRINSIGRQIKSREQLENKDVRVMSKEEAIEAWSKVEEEYDEYVSNCCGAEILEPIIDGTARCPECKEGCMAVKS